MARKIIEIFPLLENNNDLIEISVNINMIRAKNIVFTDLSNKYEIKLLVK